MYVDGPRKIGSVLTDKNGKFAAQILIPSEVVAGRYTLQINAKQGSNQIQSFHLGVNISSEVR
jgi:5-hydroxyisourate hydrolase-like protein (transthyretin family)